MTFRSADGIDNGYVAVVAVSCNACPAGRIAREREISRKYPRPTFESYTASVRGHDGLAMLAEYHRTQATRARAGQPRGSGLAEMFQRLARFVLQPQES